MFGDEVKIENPFISEYPWAKRIPVSWYRFVDTEYDYFCHQRIMEERRTFLYTRSSRNIYIGKRMTYSKGIIIG